MTKIESLNQGTVAALESHLVQLKQRLAEIDRLIAAIEEEHSRDSIAARIRFSSALRVTTFYLSRCR
jgi:predicted DNA-binding ribbon-helix-helix protein